MDVNELTAHWDSVYQTRSSTGVSWFQPEPTVSLRLVTALTSNEASVVDVGAGASLLVDRLVDLGYKGVTLLDVSSTAQSEVTERLGTRAESVTFIVSDVRTWTPDRHYDLWHDRAVFHFLNDPNDQMRYVDVATNALRPGAALVLGVFALDGPSQCSGLDVQRFEPADLQRLFGDRFVLEHSERELHVTPDGVGQSFMWVVLRRQES